MGAQLGGKLLHDTGEDALDRVLLGGVAVPDGDEVRVETDRETNAAELITCSGFRLALVGIWSRWIDIPSSRTLWSFSPMASS